MTGGEPRGPATITFSGDEPRVQTVGETGGRNGGDRGRPARTPIGGIGFAPALTSGTDHVAKVMAGVAWAQPQALPQQFPLQPWPQSWLPPDFAGEAFAAACPACAICVQW
jgi:hypothetical protein